MTDYLFSGEMREFLLDLREDLNIGGGGLRKDLSLTTRGVLS